MSKRGPDNGQDGFPKRRSHGKPMIKMLCPFYCAGAIIGKEGATIKELMENTDCDVKISKNDERFPNTSERVVSIQGDHSAVEECVLFCQDKIRKDQPPPTAKQESYAINAKRKESCKLVVSNTSAGRIIGKGGETIKKMKSDYDVKMDITRQDSYPRGFEERVVSIEGKEENVDTVVKEVVKLVCEDESASMEWHIFYNDWSSDRRDDRSFDSGRDFGGRDYGGRDFGRQYDDRPRGRYDDYPRERDSFGRGDNYGRDRDYGRGDRDYGRGDSYRESDRYRDDRDMGYRDGARDGYRDSYDRDGGRDFGRMGGGGYERRSYRDEPRGQRY